MKGVVRVFNLLVALCIMAIVLLLFWFLIARYVNNYSASDTVSYMLRTMNSWRRAVLGLFA